MPPWAPDADNGTLEMRLAAACAARAGTGIVVPPGWLTVPALPLTANERLAIGDLLGANAEVLVAVRAARAKADVDWQIPIRSPEWADQTYRLDGLGDVVALLGLAALFEHDRGNDAQALDHVRSMLYLGRSLSVRPFLFSQRSGGVVASAAARRLAEVVPDLRVAGGAGPVDRAATAHQVRELVAEFVDDRPWRDGMRQGFRAERARLVQSSRALVDGRLTFSQLRPGLASQDDSVSRARDSLAVPALDAVFRHAGRPLIFDDGVLMARHLEVVMRAFDDSPDWPTAWRRIPMVPPEAGGAWCGFIHTSVTILLPSYRWDASRYFEASAERRLAATALAVRWYACDHGGALPARLDDLVPDYLPSVPLDSLAEGTPLGYVADPDRPVVYSVGDNGKDDGGREYREDAPWPERYQTDEVRRLKREPRRVLEWKTVEPNTCAGAVPG